MSEVLPSWPDYVRAVDALIREAVIWWSSLSPDDWDQKTHLQDPTVNAKTLEEFALAKAVAKWVEANMKEAERQARTGFRIRP